MNIHIKLFILTTENKNIIYLKQNFDDFKIQLARKFRTDVLSLYRKMSSLGAPETVLIIISFVKQQQKMCTSIMYIMWLFEINNRLSSSSFFLFDRYTIKFIGPRLNPFSMWYIPSMTMAIWKRENQNWYLSFNQAGFSPGKKIGRPLSLFCGRKI